MKYTLSIKVKDEAGALARISSLFSGRGFNIHSLVVAGTEKAFYSRIILLTEGKEETIEQITKQLNKLIQVIEVKNLTPIPSIERELVFVQVFVKDLIRLRSDIEDFGAKVIDHTKDVLTIELTSTPGKIDVFLQRLESQNILQIIRTGKISMPRYSANYFQVEETPDSF